MEQLVFPFYQKILDEEAHQKRLNEIPYFIRQRGCINCDTYDKYGKKGFSHEIVVVCLLSGCRQINFPDKATGHDLYSPFIDPQWAVERARKEGDPDILDKAIAYARRIFTTFRSDYEYLGVSLTDIIGEQATA